MSRALSRRLRALEESPRLPPLRQTPPAELATLSDDELERLQAATITAEDPRADPHDRNRAAAQAAELWAAATERLAATIR
jgi:hypothetical protein